MKAIFALPLLAWAALAAHGDAFVAQCADRAAIERVYHAHRTGTKQTFEETMPRALLERLVRDDAHKEAALRKNYAVEITRAMLDAEVARINATTRAPDVLAEIKHALGDDVRRFAIAMARPILVERELRARFDNDDKLHVAQRREAEQARAALLAGKSVADMQDVTWHLTPRPAESQSAIHNPQSAMPTKASNQGGIYTNEATAQVAQPVTPLNSQPSTLNSPMISTVIALATAGVALLFLEMFLPGIIAGVIGGILLIASIFTAYEYIGPAAGTVTLIAATAVTAGLWWWWATKFQHTRFGRRMTLAATSTGTSQADGIAQWIGKTGTAVTALRPSGTIVVAGQRVDAITGGDFIEAGTPVLIVRTEGSSVVVHRQQQPD